MQRIMTLVVAAVVLSSCPVAAQTPPTQPPPWLAPVLVPIHTEPNAHTGEPELWAAGTDYKVGFTGGVQFVPYLGARAPENVVFAWRTEPPATTKTAVGANLRVPPIAIETDHRRCSYDLGWAREVWDVRPDGLEQTFEIATRPTLPGDLTITGRLTGTMRVRPRSAQHAPLELVDLAGEVVATYGVATAIDASGRSWPLTSSADGDGTRIHLHVPESVLAAAAWPLRVDPLLAPVTAMVDAAAQSLSNARVRGSTTRPVLIGYTRIASGSDGDVYVRAFSSDLTLSDVVFTRLTASAYSDKTDLATAGGVGRWIVVFQDQQNGGRVCAWHSRAVADIAPSSAFSVLTPPPGMEEWAPRVGGNDSAGGGQVPVIRERWVTGQNEHRIVVSMLAMVGGVEQAPITLTNGQFTDARMPAISKNADGRSWVVAWQQSSLLTRWRIAVRRIDANGVLALGTLSTDRGTLPVHETTPFVDGNGDRFLLAWGETDTRVLDVRPTGANTLAVRAMRFDWPDLQAEATAQPSQGIVAAGSFAFNLGGVRYDSSRRSHWAIGMLSDVQSAPTAELRLLGYHGIQVDREVLQQATGLVTASSVALCFDSLANQFRAVYRTWGAIQEVRERRHYYPDAAVTPYGGSCSTAFSTAAGCRRGSEFGTITLAGVPAGVPGLAAFSLAPANESLAALQMPGCNLLVDQGLLLTTLAFVTQSVATAFPLPVPEWVPDVDLHVQFAHAAPGANPANLQTTHGLQVQIR